MANAVWGKVIFSEVCVKNFVHRVGLPHCMLGYPVGSRPPPPEQCMLGDTGNKLAVRILLECNLVLIKISR